MQRMMLHATARAFLIDSEHVVKPPFDPRSEDSVRGEEPNPEAGNDSKREKKKRRLATAMELLSDKLFSPTCTFTPVFRCCRQRLTLL